MAFSNGTIAERLTGREVTWTYFRLLGITPAIGRDFTEQEGRPGHPRAVVISHGLWERRLGSRRDVVGQPIRLDGADYTVAGILPPQLGPFERRQDFFIAAQWSTPRRKGPFFITTLGRLREGADPIRSRQRTARDQPPPLSAVAVVVPGRSCDVGSDGSQGVRRRRHSHDGGRRAGSGGAGVADRDGERRQPARRARHEPPPRAGRAGGARRVTGTSRAVPARGERAPGRRRGRRRVVARVGRRPPPANRRRQLFSAHAGNGSQRSGAVAACRGHDRQRRLVRRSSLPSTAQAVR